MFWTLCITDRHDETACEKRNTNTKDRPPQLLMECHAQYLLILPTIP